MWGEDNDQAITAGIAGKVVEIVDNYQVKELDQNTEWSVHVNIKVDRKIKGQLCRGKQESGSY